MQEQKQHFSASEANAIARGGAMIPTVSQASTSFLKIENL
jgi:hypothetical protein